MQSCHAGGMCTWTMGEDVGEEEGTGDDMGEERGNGESTCPELIAPTGDELGSHGDGVNARC